MASTFALIHTGSLLIPVFAQLAKENLPGIDVFHMLDESLIRNTIAAGELTKTTVRRLVGMIASAREAGADAVMVTCSSIGEGTAEARRLFDFPILRVDEPLAEAAVGMGKRIGVAATLRTTLEPTIRLLRDTAERAGKKVEIVPKLSEGAFECLLAGDPQRHDRMLAGSLAELRKEVDVIVLAQASMARIAAQFSGSEGPPMLSSPELAIRRAREVLVSQTAAAR
ncbi:MAG TPA: aspartate/glutamate racemase family protein [Bryobacteraceae bacterium]|nr:aspartate/glutamate racemase family protein [Bryobacteraceae bacterium]